MRLAELADWDQPMQPLWLFFAVLAALLITASVAGLYAQVPTPLCVVGFLVGVWELDLSVRLYG